MHINGGDTMLTLTPVALATANAFVNAHHRHHKATAGHKFSIGCAKDGELVGVAIVGRPVSRYLDDGWTLEVNRLCTTGEKNACSILYAASARAAKAMGYRKIITYTLDSESGSSLRAAGWNCAGLAGGKCWTGSRKYKATAYIRLSYTDDHSGESDSVSNQRKLIENFVERNPDIEVVSEKIDDGYSGIIFDRPAFKEMMQDVTDGNINCVIVKDLSRLGREYIETGRYLRRVFPAYGVRFIRLVAQTTTTEAAQSLLIFLEDRNIFTQFHTYQKSLFFVYCGAVFALA